MFRVFEHTADLGLHIEADTLEALFAEAGRALFSLVVANLHDVRPVEQVEVQVAREPPDLWLFDWLGELLYLFETRHLLLSEFVITFTDDALRAVCRGEPVDRQRHRLEHEVKAVTYHGLRCEQKERGWVAELIVDI